MNRSNQLDLQWMASKLNKQPSKHVCNGCRCSNWQGDRLDEDGNEEGEALKGEHEPEDHAPKGWVHGDKCGSGKRDNGQMI